MAVIKRIRNSFLLNCFDLLKIIVLLPEHSSKFRVYWTGPSKTNDNILSQMPGSISITVLTYKKREMILGQPRDAGCWWCPKEVLLYHLNAFVLILFLDKSPAERATRDKGSWMLSFVLLLWHSPSRGRSQEMPRCPEAVQLPGHPCFSQSHTTIVVFE